MPPFSAISYRSAVFALLAACCMAGAPMAAAMPADMPADAPAALSAARAAGAAEAAPSASTLPPLASFFDNAGFGGAVLSPGGRYLAARTGAPGKRMILAVIDLQTNAAKVVAGYNDADIGHMVWVNDERIAFDLTDRDVGPGDTFRGAGLYAVNRDGTRLRQLADRSFVAASDAGNPSAVKLLPWHTALMSQAGAQDAESLYVTSYDFDHNGQVHDVNLLHLNTLTGKAVTVQRPGRVQNWVLDAQGKPRLAAGYDRDQSTLYYLDPADDKWRTLATYRSYGDGKNTIAPLGFGPDGTLYVIARNGADTQSLYVFDLKAGKLKPEPLVETQGYDFAGSLRGNRSKLLGIGYLTDAEGVTWFDPAMKALQDKIDKLLPDTVNTISTRAGPDAHWALVQAHSDRQPPVYLLYHLQTGQLSTVGESHPAIDSRAMGRQQVVRYKARDGLDIPALLTLPPNTPNTSKGARLPMVVLVHGGPYVRGSTWGWAAESQFLASRGYAVLEPEFRGSTGFGAKHFTAGFKQWGLAMQDDIADGTRWAIAQGIADPKRVCIAGASYGGYATLMGLIRDPDVYKCGIDWVGVTDIKLLYDGHWSFKSDMGDEWHDYGMPEMIGDPVKDADQLAATSPLRLASRIRQPLLMAYGGVDRRVPAYHGRAFYDAVTQTNKDVEWVLYAEEGHGWALPKNRIDFWGRVEAFLNRNIGAKAPD